MDAERKRASNCGSVASRADEHAYAIKKALAISETYLVITKRVAIAFLNVAVVDFASLILDAVGAAKIAHIPTVVLPDYGSVAARDVPVFDREVRGFAPASDDELFFIHRETLAVENYEKWLQGTGSSGIWKRRPIGKS